MSIQVEVPPLGESITQAILVKWHKADGDSVAVDEALCELETDKANVDIPAKTSGIVHRLKEEGESVNVGEAIARIDDSPAVSTKEPVTPRKLEQPRATGGLTASALAAPAERVSTGSKLPVAPRPEDLSPAVRRLVEENHLDPKSIPATGPGGRITKEDVERHLAKSGAGALTGTALTLPSPGVPGEGKDVPTRASAPLNRPPVVVPVPSPAQATPPAFPVPTRAPAPLAAEGISFDASGVHRVPMSKIRRRIAERLVEAQSTAAILTTFNEIDLTEVISLRNKFKERFQEVYGVGLGFMSFFARVTVLALKELPRLNAFIEGDDIVYHNYVHLGIAVSTERGLAVPILRNVQDMSFARIEAEIKRLATATREGKLGLEELSGGTFTITNGGVFGSLLSTPILTPPQSGILGMHTIQKRPVVIEDKIEVRSMMYVALSYDHRLVDGREAITFLVRLKQMLEEPARLMLEI